MMNAIARLKDSVKDKPRGWRSTPKTKGMPPAQHHAVNVAGDVLDVCLQVVGATQIVQDLTMGCGAVEPDRMVHNLADDIHHLIEIAEAEALAVLAPPVPPALPVEVLATV